MTQTKTREDYPDLYSYRAENLWKEVSDHDDLTYPKVISFFCRQNGFPVSGVEAKIKETTYPIEMPVKEAFILVQNLMVTKKLTKGKRETLRSSMGSLKPHEEYLLGCLLNHLRELHMDGEVSVLLTYQEYYLLKNGGFSKPKKKSK